MADCSGRSGVPLDRHDREVLWQQLCWRLASCGNELDVGLGRGDAPGRGTAQEIRAIYEILDVIGFERDPKPDSWKLPFDEPTKPGWIAVFDGIRAELIDLTKEDAGSRHDEVPAGLSDPEELLDADLVALGVMNRISAEGFVG